MIVLDRVTSSDVSHCASLFAIVYQSLQLRNPISFRFRKEVRHTFFANFGSGPGTAHILCGAQL